MTDRRVMATYLLSWNPERWPWESLDEDIGRAARGEIVEMEWATGNTKRIAPGDRLFLLRQGPNRPGIMGAGVAVREVQPGPHFDQERREAGETASYTVVRFDQLVPVQDVLPAKALRTDAELGTFGWKPLASGWAVPQELEAPLEARWTEHLTSLDLPILPAHARFRAIVERALAARPRRTPKGVLVATTRVGKFGSRVGPHEHTTCWVYQRSGTNLELWLGFFSNFTDDDLICKVLSKGEAPGTGATIQFNGEKSVEPHRAGGFALRHSGSVTVGTPVGRAELVELIEAAAPAEAAALGGLDPASSWPLRIGTTADIDALLDRLFDYAFVIEQAKRAKREEPRLPALPAPEVEPRRQRGQGYAVDIEAKTAVERHAMERARAHFAALGYEVEDHSDRASYDLLARKNDEQVWVEVKGTRGDGSAVLVTANEVEHARSHHPHLALVVVMGISFRREPKPTATGGEVVVYWPWDPDEHRCVPTAFRCDLDTTRASEPEP